MPFETYDFDGDAKWQAHRVNVLVPPNRDEAEVMALVKQKWYKKHVDPTYEVKRAAPKKTYAYSAPPQSQSTTPEPAPQSTTPEPAPQSTTPEPPQPSARVQSKLAMLRTSGFALFIHGFVLVNVVLYFVPGTGGMGAKGYSNALLSSCLAYGVNLVRTRGWPKFSAEFMQTYMMADDFQYALFCVVWMGRPVTLALFPLAIFSTYQAAFAAAQVPVVSRFVGALCAKLTAVQSKALGLVAQFESGLLLVSIVSLFTGQGGLLSLFVYAQWLSMRYKANAYCHAVMDQLDMAVSRVLYSRYVPGVVLTVYQKIKGFLAR